MSTPPTDLRPGESIARCFFFACDGCDWRLAFWSYQCLECGHWGCARTDLSPLDAQQEHNQAGVVEPA